MKKLKAAWEDSLASEKEKVAASAVDAGSANEQSKNSKEIKNLDTQFERIQNLLSLFSTYIPTEDIEELVRITEDCSLKIKQKQAQEKQEKVKSNPDAKIIEQCQIEIIEQLKTAIGSIEGKITKALIVMKEKEKGSEQQTAKIDKLKSIVGLSRELFSGKELLKKMTGVESGDEYTDIFNTIGNKDEKWGDLGSTEYLEAIPDLYQKGGDNGIINRINIEIDDLEKRFLDHIKLIIMRASLMKK